jgi:hypothetical protein
MYENRLHNIGSSIPPISGKDYSAKQAAVFIETNTDARSCLKYGRLQIGCGADY